MRKLEIALSVFLFCSLPLAHGQKYRMGQAPPGGTNPTDFPIKVHISGSRLRLNCYGNSNGAFKVSCAYGLYADADLDGKKVELWGSSNIGKYKSAILAPGNYMAQLTKDSHNADQTVLSQSYSLLLPDGTVWQCTLSGVTE